ncbi:MAG: DNA-binding GntR family transcriptional regulator [Gammaproteobacteria bacterium]
MLKPVAQEAALTDRVRDAILEAIVDGSLRPGERLAQARIAEHLGVSRQPVSHALSVLKEQGIVVEFGRKGLTVVPIDAGHVRHLYQVRGALDALAARLAAERVKSGQADARSLDELQVMVRSNARGRTTAGQQVDADIAFHTAIYALSENPILQELARPHWVQFRRCMLTVLEDDNIRADVWPEHDKILAAIVNGDADSAGSAAQQHTHRAGESTAARLMQA